MSRAKEVSQAALSLARKGLSVLEEVEEPFTDRDQVAVVWTSQTATMVSKRGVMTRRELRFLLDYVVQMAERRR